MNQLSKSTLAYRIIVQQNLIVFSKFSNLHLLFHPTRLFILGKMSYLHIYFILHNYCFFCANVHTFINFEFLSNKSYNFHIFFEIFWKIQKTSEKPSEKLGNFEKYGTFLEKTIKIGSKRLYLNDYCVLHVY